MRRRGQPPLGNQRRSGTSFAVERKRLRSEPRVSVSLASSSRPSVTIATGQGAEMRCASAACMMPTEGLSVSNKRKGTWGNFSRAEEEESQVFLTGVSGDFWSVANEFPRAFDEIGGSRKIHPMCFGETSGSHQDVWAALFFFELYSF